MSAYTVDAFYGDAANTSAIPANMMNQFAADGGADWNSIIANGIRGAAQAGIAAMVNEKYADGQLKPLPTAAAPAGALSGETGLIVLAVIAYLLLK